MSKKTLLEESTIRKFMKLANLEPLSDNFIKEELGYTEEDDMTMGAGDDEMSPVDDAGGMDGMDDEGGLEVDLDDAGAEGDVSPEVAKKVLQAVMDALGVQGTVEDDEDMGGADDMGDMDDFGGDEETGEDEGEEEAGGEEDFESEEDEDEGEEELDEQEAKEKLSEDDLVENVLRRVTARLVAEAKDAKARKGIKEKMKEKKYKKKGGDAEKLDEENHVKTHKKSNPLLTKGKNKHNVYKGVEDQSMGKGEKGGSGGHEWKPTKSSKNHIVTNKKNVNNLSSKGKNKS